ncbi:MAG: hypothetical protein IJB79_05800 [Candidatus Gastranaerophilales bacterium]|nr:hypothetical protein [Candidatus Gastranaerophilales bacterium]
MKKILLTFLALMGLSLSVLADDKTDVLNTFEKYVNDANSYSTTIPNYYMNNAKILRVVNKKQGGQATVVIPFDRYLKEMQTHSKIAKVTNYKNRYENRKVTQIGNDYKISSIRIPRNDKTGLPCHFIFTKVGDKWKIKEESMQTNVQTFLNAK